MAGGQRKHDEAVAWLRGEERAADGRDKWIFAVVVFGALIGFVTLVTTLDRIVPRRRGMRSTNRPKILYESSEAGVTLA